MIGKRKYVMDNSGLFSVWGLEGKGRGNSKVTKLQHPFLTGFPSFHVSSAFSHASNPKPKNPKPQILQP